MILYYGKMLTEEEVERKIRKWKNFRPSLLQRVVWFFWPTLTSQEYSQFRPENQNIKRMQNV